MSSYDLTSSATHKPLPPPARDEKLPLPPPADSQGHFVPNPPPKFGHDGEATMTHPHQPPPLNLNVPDRHLSPGSPLPSPGFAVSSVPASPSTPSGDTKHKRSNPLIDLIETEKVYVDLLSGVIRKVASAWSRSSMPPPDLDTMFRSIESIYKANRSLLAKLKEIGTNPASPKLLGDLLMRWIEDLDGPYTTYCTKFMAGFDTWEQIQSNPRLAGVLQTFSEAHPPSSNGTPSIWSLDSLFLLPRGRIKYYQKLYGRLLKNTNPGRSSDKLLTEAVDKLDRLMNVLDERSKHLAGESDTARSIVQPDPADEVVIAPTGSSNVRSDSQRTVRYPEAPPDRDSVASSGKTSSYSSGERSSRETSMTSEGSLSLAASPINLAELDKRLVKDQCIDIFTMKPRDVAVILNNPSLPFTRELHLVMDVTIRFTPRCTGQEIIHPRGRIFILTDLLLICDLFPSNNGFEDPDLRLCYPPLALRVLRVAPAEGSAEAVQLTIVKKETMVFQVDSSIKRDVLFKELQMCINLATALPPQSKNPPPPVPALPRSPSAPSLNNHPSFGSASGPRIPGRVSDSASESTLQPLHNAPSARDGSFPPDRPFSTDPAAPPPYNAGLSNHHPIDDRRGDAPTSFAPGQVIPNGPSPSLGSSMGPGSQAPLRLPIPQGQSAPQITPPPRGESMRSPPTAGGLPSNPRANDLPPLNAPTPRQPIPGGPFQPNNGGSFPPGPPQAGYPQQYPRSAPSTPAPAGPYPPNPGFTPSRQNSASSSGHVQPRPMLPSAALGSRAMSAAVSDFFEPSPPSSPVESRKSLGPVESAICAQMKCKVFLKQQHAQWKNLGSAQLVLYDQRPTNVKQIVVTADNKDKTMLISTIVLTDGVERVGRTGVAIELSDNGARTGIVYMIQLRNEKSAGGLFDTLLQNSDRSAKY